MEIMIVLVILSLTMGLSLASIQGGFGGSALKTNLRHMQAMFSTLRHQALLDGKPKTLQIQLDGLGGATYTIKDPKNPEQKRQEKNFLSEDTELEGIEKTPGKLIQSGSVQIVFSAQGLASPARFHLAGDGKTIIVELQAFSPELKVEEDGGMLGRPYPAPTRPG